MKRFADSLLVALVIVVCWQCLHWAVGNHSLSSPLSTVEALIQMLGTAPFWDNAAETARALAYALVIALAGGAAEAKSCARCLAGAARVEMQAAVPDDHDEAASEVLDYMVHSGLLWRLRRERG